MAPPATPGFTITETIWRTVIFALSSIVLLVTLYCLSHGITVIFMHLYYLPIVLLAYHYRRRGFFGVILLSLAYLFLSLAYDWGEWFTIEGAAIRVIVFISIGALVMYLSEHLVQTREELEKTLQIKKSIIQNTNVWLMVLDAKGRVMEWNTAAEEMSGYSAEEVTGKNDIWKSIYPDKDYRREITTQIKDIIEKESYLANLKTTISHRDGSLRTLLWNTKKLPREGNEADQFIAIGVDVTERTLAEEELNASEKRFRDLVENIDEVLYLRDIHGIITYISPMVKKMFGYSPEEIVGHNIEEFIFQADLPEVRKALTTGNQGTGASYQFRVVAKSGGYRWVNCSIQPVFEKGEISGVRGVLSDITERKQMEDALRESRQLLEEILNAITVRVFWKDRNLVYLGCNTSFAHDAGFEKPEDIIGKDDYTMGWRHEAERYRADDREVIESRAPKLMYEEPQTTPAGETIHLLTNKIPLLDPTGNVIGVLGTYLDITDRKHAQEEIKRSMERFRTVMNSIDALVYVVDMNTYEILFLNKYGKDMWGKIEGMTCWQTIQKDQEGPCAFCTNDKIVDANGQPTGIYNWEFQNTVNGRWYDCRDSAIRWLDGRLVRLEIATDITGRKKIEGALRNSEEKYRQLIEQTEVGVWIVDREYRTTFVNTRLAQMFGYTLEEMTGKYVMEFMPVPDQEKHKERIKERLDGKSDRFEQQFVRKDGSRFWVIASTNPVLESGKITGAFSMLTDITDRKSAEELQHHFTEELERQVLARTNALNASLQEKTVLLREIHHRVKNNLQIIISLTNLQIRQVDDELLKKALSETQNRVRALSLVHEKLYQSEDLSQINLAAYTRSLVTQLFTYYGVDSRRVTIHLEVEKRMTDINTAIPLGLIMNELVSNILKHAFPGERGGEVTIQSKEEGDSLVISVQDNGVGFSEGCDWRQMESLGLHLVRSLVGQIHGTIEMVPLSPGTLFRITIPSGKEGVV